MHLKVRRPIALLLLVAFAACDSASDKRHTAAPPTAPIRTGANATAAKSELKVLVRADQVSAARKTFGLTDATAKRGEVFFYDTQTLELDAMGLILRARTQKGGGDDATVKLRPLACSAVAASWYKLDGFKCEDDRTGASVVESCSYTIQQSALAIDEVSRGTRTIEALFSDKQRDFARTYARVAPDWSKLKTLGPVISDAWKVNLPEVAARVEAELWTLPDGTQLLEISTKASQLEADGTAAKLDAALRSRGLDTTSNLVTKTSVTLKSLVVQ